MRNSPLRRSRLLLALPLACACAGPDSAGPSAGPSAVGPGTDRGATLHLEAQNAIGPYSAAVATGDLVFLAGKGGDPAKPFKDEVSGAIDSIEQDLARLGLTLADVVSVNVFVTDMTRFAELNEVYAARFVKPYPARTTVAAAALPKGLHVELQAIARRR